MTAVYAMIIEDPHTDVEVRLYADLHRAVAAAVTYADDQVDGTGTDVERVNADGNEIYLTWAGNYAVRVVAREVIT